MTDVDVGTGEGVDEINLMVSGRKSPAVLKIRLLDLRATDSSCVVIAFEGDDDKAVFGQWIRRLRPDLEYEPFPCDGKQGVFDLQDILDRDLGDLKRGIFYFIDRDFDDLRDRTDDPRVFMTDRYSIENYIVNGEVLTELLKEEFHCHGQPKIRAEVVGLFHKQFDEFAKLMTEFNFRIFLARRLQITILDSIPKKIRTFVDVELKTLTDAGLRPEDAIKLKIDPDPAQVTTLRQEFNKLFPLHRHRGKFFLGFFMSWLRKLADDRRNPQGALFATCANHRSVDMSAISLGMLATKCRSMPQGLEGFLARVAY